MGVVLVYLTRQSPYLLGYLDIHPAEKILCLLISVNMCPRRVEVTDSLVDYKQ